jgi:hypothetical protein
MKLNELMAELKRMDGELNKLYERRSKSVAGKATLYVDKMTLEEIKRAEADFGNEQSVTFQKIDLEIKELSEKIIWYKTKQMEFNVRYGLNDKIIRLKMIRIELSKLMELVKGERYIYDRGSDKTVERLCIYAKIDALEDEKRKLDAELQYSNWQIDVT